MAGVIAPHKSRQLAVLPQAAARVAGQIPSGSAVGSAEVQSLREHVLEFCINQEIEEQNRLKSYLNSMHQVQSVFNESGGAGLGDALSRFFKSFEELGSNPTEVSIRQAVISAGQNLAANFQRAVQQLRAVQEGVDRIVNRTVEEINSETAQLASLNQQIASVQGQGEQAERLEGQQPCLVKSLAERIAAAATHAHDGSLGLAAARGFALPAGARSLARSAGADPSDALIFRQVAEKTAKLKRGHLAGLLETRDGAIPSLYSYLDDLASGIIHWVNIQHRKGYDLKGDRGDHFFQPVVEPAPGSAAGAAANMAMAVADPRGIAASSDGTPGDNANAQAMANLQNRAVVNGETATDYYLNLVCTVGNKVSSATDEQEAVGLVLRQLQNQRADIAGGSWDEEAANLVRYQRAYEAAAEVVAAINDIRNEVIPS